MHQPKEEFPPCLSRILKLRSGRADLVFQIPIDIWASTLPKPLRLLLFHFYNKMAANQELLEDLIYCARYGEFEDLKESKAAPELFITKDEDGNTALHMASANNHLGKRQNGTVTLKRC